MNPPTDQPTPADLPAQPAQPAQLAQPARTRRWLTLPVKIGLGFGALGLLLTVVGILRGQVPVAPLNIAVALLIGGGVWFVVAWAVAAAAVDVERDLE